MRLNEPRVPALSDDEMPEAVAERLGEGPTLNIFRTMANHPDLMRRWMVFANHILAKSTLPERERELVILRIGWLCRAGYEWGQHVRIGLDAGLSQAEIDRIPAGSDADGWSDLDKALLDATDELHDDAFISDPTWERLGELDTQQKMDLVFTVGQYNLVSMALNTLGVQAEPDLAPFPD